MKIAQRRPIVIALSVAAAYAVFAAMLRLFTGYPICPNDESSWIYIAHQLDRGVAWPVSGPAFIDTAREISHLLGSAHLVSISLLGVVGVFIGICALQWGYRKFRLITPCTVLLALALSSYFWAPLLEARPQQWGQILVFLGVICAWLWLHRSGGTAFFLVLLCAAVTHILSHTILVFLCSMLVIADFAEKRPLTKRHLLLLVATFLSMGIYFIPNGPYAAMLTDLEQVQLKRLALSIPYLVVSLLIGTMALAWSQRKWHWRPHWSTVAADHLARRKTAIGLSTLCIAFTAISIQAYLLPAEAWNLYRGSWLRFFIFQLGNLMFAGFFVVGAFGVIDGLRIKHLDSTMGRLLIWILVAFGMLSALSVTVSWWLLHTNWFLRVLNYGIFFAAIVAAIGIDQTTKKWPAPAKYALLSIGILASILAVVRPPQLLGC